MSVPDEKVFFVDTNILLHFEPLSQIDWCKIVGAKVVRLAICLEVIKELDQHKRSPRLKDRAEDAIKEIERHADTDQPIREEVYLTVFNEPVRFEEMVDTASRDDVDDRILQLVAQYEAGLGEVEAVVTDDYNMRLRCRASGRKAIALDKEWRRNLPGDELTKKNKKLKARVDMLENRLPKLDITATPVNTGPSSGDFCRFTLGKEAEPVVVKTELKKESRRMPLVLSEATPALRMGLISQSACDTYNSQREDYLHEYEEYLGHLNSYREVVSRSIEFDIWILNTGNVPADDIEAVVTFPSKLITVMDAESDEGELLREGPERPEPPELW